MYRNSPRVTLVLIVTFFLCSCGGGEEGEKISPREVGTKTGAPTGEGEGESAEGEGEGVEGEGEGGIPDAGGIEETKGDAGKTTSDAGFDGGGEQRELDGGPHPAGDAGIDAGKTELIDSGIDAGQIDGGWTPPVEGELPPGNITTKIIAHIAPPMQINGKFGEWQNADSVLIAPSSVESTGGMNVGVNGDDDCSATAALLWDGDYLYVAAEVIDDDEDHLSSQPSAWWEEDTFALMFDLDNDRSGSDWLPGDCIIAFRLNPAGGANSVWLRRGRSSGAEEVEAPQTIQKVVVKTDAGYKLEAAIPISLLESILGEDLPERVGLSLLITDPDGDEVHQIQWAGQRDDKATWGRLEFDQLPVTPDGGVPESDGGVPEVDGGTAQPDGGIGPGHLKPIPPPRTFFQTNMNYDERVDLQTDFVAVHMHESPALVASWKNKGYPVYKMFFIGSDAKQDYWQGQWDGKSHAEDRETRKDGSIIDVEGRPYIVPSPAWTNYCKEIIRRGIDAGAVGILPEEPLLHSSSGYSDGFKQRWQEFYGEPWQDPQSSVNAFWKASKLKDHLYYQLAKDLADETKNYAAQKGRNVEYMLAVHSIISFAAGKMIFAFYRASQLPNVDSYVAQIWTWPARICRGKYNGKDNDSYFDGAYLAFSHFANLFWNRDDKKLYFLADPVEDDLNYSWPEYEFWYKETVLGGMFYYWVGRYEVMPWPDRVFMPGFPTGGGTPGPQDYLKQLMATFRAQQELGEQTTYTDFSLTNDIAFPVNDTIQWQRDYDKGGSEMESFHGPVLPLLKEGIPIQIIPAERATESGYLDRFSMIILSYEMWKPLDPAFHDAIVNWVKKGGHLIYISGPDPFNDVDEWWKQQGYASPQDHLFEKLGLGIDVKRKKEINALLKKLTPVSGCPLASEVPEISLKLDWKKNVVLYPVTTATPLYEISGESGYPIFEQQVGKGKVLVIGILASTFANMSRGASWMMAFARYAYPGSLGTQKFLQIKRGPYVGTRVNEGTKTLHGTYIDIWNPEFPIVRDPVLQAGKPYFHKDVAALLQDSTPRILFSNQKLEGISESANRTEFTAKGPRDVEGVVIISKGQRTLDGVDGAQVDDRGDNIRVRIPNTNPGGVHVVVRWR